MAHDVFISYATSDKTTADAVCARLEHNGIRCWMAPRDILPGSSWKPSIVAAIKASRVLVLIFSAHANESTEVPKEVDQAVKNGLSIVTFRIENVPPISGLDYELTGRHWLDALTPPLERHIDQLTTTLSAVLDRPAPDVVAAPKLVRETRLSSAVIVGVAVLALAVAGGVGWFVARTARSSPDTARVEPSPPPPVETHVPAPPVETRVPAPPLPVPPRPEPSAADGPSLAKNASGEPQGLTGCWSYKTFLPLLITITADGRVTGFLDGARWVRSGGQYVITWPRSVDTLTLSADGLTLAGTNNYGGPDVLGRRGSGDPRSLTGSWQWSNGQPTTFRDDGGVSNGPVPGRWTKVASTIRIVWEFAFVDQLTLAPDGGSIAGKNQFGVSVSGVRVPCAA
jgi:hypothetical protein